MAEPTDMAEVELRAQIEAEVRADHATVMEMVKERSRAAWAFAISMSVIISAAILLLALVLGAAVRIFCFISGLR